MCETVNHTTATLVVAIPTAESQLERKSEREKEINKGQQRLGTMADLTEILIAASNAGTFGCCD